MKLQGGQVHKIYYHYACHIFTTICKGSAGRMILLGRPDPARGP